jgi:hypothetical protein
MATEMSLLSQTIHSITTTKIREQAKRRKTFEAKKSEVLETVNAAPDDCTRLELLLSAFKKLLPSNKGVPHVEQNRNDIAQNVSGRNMTLPSQLLRPLSKASIATFDRDLTRNAGASSLLICTTAFWASGLAATASP